MVRPFPSSNFRLAEVRRHLRSSTATRPYAMPPVEIPKPTAAIPAVDNSALIPAGSVEHDGPRTQWSSGLCACMTDWCTCCTACWCVPTTTAQLYERFHSAKGSCMKVGLLLWVLAAGLWMYGGAGPMFLLGVTLLALLASGWVAHSQRRPLLLDLAVLRLHFSSVPLSFGMSFLRSIDLADRVTIIFLSLVEGLSSRLGLGRGVLVSLG